MTDFGQQSDSAGELLSRMSHELRTPLNAILGFGQLLAADRTLSATQHDNAARIVAAGRRLLALIDEVLDVSQLDVAQLDDGAGPADPRVAVADEPRTRKVLCVEDNEINMRLIEALIGTDPRFQLQTAYDGASCLELVSEQPPDAILLDLELGDLSGEEVLRRLQADPATAAIPVVFLTAEANAEHARELRHAGARAYLSKPLDLAEFLRTIDEVLGVCAS